MLLFSLKIVSFSYIWKGENSNESGGWADQLSSEIIQIDLST